MGDGSITCNYDGMKKYTTVIGDDVLVSSNTQFIALIKISKNMIFSAGTTLIQNVNTSYLVYNKKTEI